MGYISLAIIVTASSVYVLFGARKIWANGSHVASCIYLVLYLAYPILAWHVFTIEDAKTRFYFAIPVAGLAPVWLLWGFSASDVASAWWKKVSASEIWEGLKEIVVGSFWLWGGLAGIVVGAGFLLEWIGFLGIVFIASVTGGISYYLISHYQGKDRKSKILGTLGVGVLGIFVYLWFVLSFLAAQ